MSMKSASDPRRVYCRNGVTHVLYAGTVFGTKEESAISTKHPVKIEGNGDGTITISQRLPFRAATEEKWGKVKVPSKERAAKAAKNSRKSSPRTRKVAAAAPAPTPVPEPVVEAAAPAPEAIAS
jgi:hypothetical protein